MRTLFLLLLTSIAAGSHLRHGTYLRRREEGSTSCPVKCETKNLCCPQNQECYRDTPNGEEKCRLKVLDQVSSALLQGASRTLTASAVDKPTGLAIDPSAFSVTAVPTLVKKPATTSQTSQASGGDRTPSGAIAGGVIGGLAGVGAIAGVAGYMFRRRQRREDDQRRALETPEEELTAWQVDKDGNYVPAASSTIGPRDEMEEEEGPEKRESIPVVFQVDGMGPRRRSIGFGATVAELPEYGSPSGPGFVEVEGDIGWRRNGAARTVYYEMDASSIRGGKPGNR